MKKIILFTSILALNTSIKSAEKKQLEQKITEEQTQEIAPGVSISVNLSNSHPVNNQNTTSATASQGSEKSTPQRVEHIIVIKHQQELSYKNTFISLLVGCLPIGATFFTGRKPADPVAGSVTAIIPTKGVAMMTGAALKQSGQFQKLLEKYLAARG